MQRLFICIHTYRFRLCRRHHRHRGRHYSADCPVLREANLVQVVWESAGCRCGQFGEPARLELCMPKKYKSVN
jgi:hypothetical protein